ncbi:MAG TPA: MFS transporter, partial [Lacunisphaera sp.]|nr:MFS transporter [Lacunisphaera sp.]
MTSNSATPSAAKEGLRRSEYIGYALGDTASNLFFQTFGLFLTYYYTDVWGLAPAAVATMFLVIRLSDAVTDPLVGMLADRTQTRWGKFRPYILWSAVPYGAAGYLLFASPNLDAPGKLVYAYLSYGLMMLAYTFINVPYSSLLGVISPSPRIRTLASSYRFVGAFGGGLLISLLGRPLVKWLGDGADASGRVVNELKGFQLTMLIFAVLSVVMF